MKSVIKAALSWGVVLASVFTPFLVVLDALFLLPSGVYIGKSPDALDWMWLMLLGAMMLGIYLSDGVRGFPGVRAHKNRSLAEFVARRFSSWAGGRLAGTAKQYSNSASP